jgi:polyisoprenoid-binding protein YceI
MLRTILLGLLLGAVAVAQAAPPARAIDTAHSRLTVHVGKSGMLSAFGHEHEIAAPAFSGSVRGQEAVELLVDARALKVADAEVSDSDRATIQSTMLGPEVLDVARYPEIRFHSTAVEPAKAGEWRVRGELTLHGQTHPVVVTVKEAGGRYSGACAFKQTDFGIKPVSAGGGSVKVKDELRIAFEIALQ